MISADSNMVEYPLGPELYDSSDKLYDIQRIKLDYEQLEFRGGVQSGFRGMVNMHKDLDRWLERPPQS